MPPTPSLEGILCPLCGSFPLARGTQPQGGIAMISPIPPFSSSLFTLHCDKGFIQDLLHIPYVGLTTGVLRDLCYN